jgi:pyruvate, orthophosphate dikinase
MTAGAAHLVDLVIDHKYVGAVNVRCATASGTSSSHPSRRIEDVERPQLLATGVNASPGAACGAIVLDADTAERLGREGQDVILVRSELTADDVHGMIQAKGLLTMRGGMTSDAAVVARGMGKPCVAGCEELTIDPAAGSVTLGAVELSAGDVITIDGGAGTVYLGAIPLVPEDAESNRSRGDE